MENTLKLTKERTKELTKQLSDGIQELFESKDFAKYLKFCSNRAFAKYSFNNCSLIMYQNPNASYVAGYNTWKNEFNRTIKKGEKAIYILAPSKYKKKEKKKNDDGTEEEVEVEHFGYRTIPVFDISQTEGDDIPNFNKSIAEDIEDNDTLIDALSKATTIDVVIDDDNTRIGYIQKLKNIHLRYDMSDSDMTKELVYGIAMHIFSNDFSSYASAKAEGVAYIVCENFGIDTSNQSFAKLAEWGIDKDVKELKNCMNDIKRVAEEIIEATEKYLFD